MGLSIHYLFLRDKSPEPLLKKAEILAQKIGFKIEERAWNKLIINPHEDSEWIELHFHKAKTILKRKGWDLEKKQLERKRLGDFDSEDWICGGFVKTPYAGYKIHIKVAEFMRIIAGHCEKSEVYDESGYYEEGYSKKSEQKLKEFLDDYNKGLASMGNQLKEIFGTDKVLMGSDQW